MQFDDYDPVDKIILEKNHSIKGSKLEVKKALPRDADMPAMRGGRGGQGGRGEYCFVDMLHVVTWRDGLIGIWSYGIWYSIWSYIHEFKNVFTSASYLASRSLGVCGVRTVDSGILSFSCACSYSVIRILSVPPITVSFFQRRKFFQFWNFFFENDLVMIFFSIWNFFAVWNFF